MTTDKIWYRCILYIIIFIYLFTTFVLNVIFSFQQPLCKQNMAIIRALFFKYQRIESSVSYSSKTNFKIFADH